MGNIIINCLAGIVVVMLASFIGVLSLISLAVIVLAFVVLNLSDNYWDLKFLVLEKC